jgi:hypothetical protein
MSPRTRLALPLAGALLVPSVLAPLVLACCPAPPAGEPVVNADQTVIILWDAATRTQHFIRQASFRSAADDFGFLVPTPTRPELNESGNEAFPFLQKLTEPETRRVPRPRGGTGCGCGDAVTTDASAPAGAVRVLEEKQVAGFNAVVLEADSADALVDWLEGHGYAFSPEVEAWAQPYVEAGWKITALKVAKPEDGRENRDVAASALRMSFRTDRPLFPYREPDSTGPARTLGANRRLLRIYFLAEARYRGELTPDDPWTGRVVWASPLNPGDRRRALELLGLPEATGPAAWWLTEFEDPWPYRVAPADVSFSRDPAQTAIKRPPIIEYVWSPWPADPMVFALAAVAALPRMIRRVRRGRIASA